MSATLLACVESAALCAAPAGEPALLAFEIEGVARVAYGEAWGEGRDLIAARATLERLGLAAPPGAYVRLGDLGARWRLDEARSAIVFTCTAACYAPHVLDRPSAPPAADGAPLAGAMLGYDVMWSRVDGRAEAGALIDATAFSAFGFGEANVLLREGEQAVRLDTAWTFDDPRRRLRLSLGDAISRGGPAGAPIRFGGLKFGTDFSLDPGFSPFPAPALSGEAALPATVDLYVDDVLRWRGETAGGPFSLTDPPVTTGAGAARLIVTDMLGRQQAQEQRFYMSPALLRSGLSDFTIDMGFERRLYGAVSNDYGAAFLSGAVRRGLAPALTAEARGEASDDHLGAGVGATIAAYAFGQIDLSGAISRNANDVGHLVRFGWTREGRALSYAASVEAAGDDFRRLGDIYGPAPLRATASVGGPLGPGDASLNFTHAERSEGRRVRTLSARYGLSFARRATLSLAAAWGEAEGDRFQFWGLTLSAPLMRGVHSAATIENDEVGLTAGYRLQRSAPSAGGLGWRLAQRTGAEERASAAASFLGAAAQGEAEIAAADDVEGTRLRVSGAMGTAGGALFLARAAPDAFAVVEAAPDMRVSLDNRPVGRTDARGRLVVSNLRGYEAHRLGVDVRDAPWGAAVETDALYVAPAARGAVRARFPIVVEEGRWVRVRDAAGRPAQPGSLLRRDADGAAFFVGADGRAYLSAPPGQDRFAATIGGRACVIAALTEEAICAPSP